LPRCQRLDWRRFQSPNAHPFCLKCTFKGVHSLVGLVPVNIRHGIGQQPIERIEPIWTWVGIRAMQQDPSRPIHLPGGWADMKAIIQLFAMFCTLDHGWVTWIECVCLEWVSHGRTSMAPSIGQWASRPKVGSIPKVRLLRGAGVRLFPEGRNQ